MYDGGSELSLLEAVPEHERTDAQTEALQWDPEAWCRPCFALRAPDGKALSMAEEGNCVRESVYGKAISQFAVGQSPAYRRHGTLKDADPARHDGQSRRSAGEQPAASAEEVSADRWESFFAQDLWGLVPHRDLL